MLCQTSRAVSFCTIGSTILALYDMFMFILSGRKPPSVALHTFECFGFTPQLLIKRGLEFGGSSVCEASTPWPLTPHQIIVVAIFAPPTGSPALAIGIILDKEARACIGGVILPAMISRQQSITRERMHSGGSHAQENICMGLLTQTSRGWLTSKICPVWGRGWGR